MASPDSELRYRQDGTAILSSLAARRTGTAPRHHWCYELNARCPRCLDQHHAARHHVANGAVPGGNLKLCSNVDEQETMPGQVRDIAVPIGSPADPCALRGRHERRVTKRLGGRRRKSWNHLDIQVFEVGNARLVREPADIRSSHGRVPRWSPGVSRPVRHHFGSRSDQRPRPSDCCDNKNPMVSAGCVSNRCPSGGSTTQGCALRVQK